MAQTIKSHIKDGVQTIYPVSFDLGYVSRDYVYVYTGDDYTVQIAYTWLNDSQIEITDPTPSSQEFFIRRVVPRNEPFNDYVDGAVLREENLDDSFVQALMINEELSDGFANPDDANERFVLSTGDTMTGELSGINSTQAAGFMPQLQVTETIDARMSSAPEFDPNNFQDYGLVTESVTDSNDYGSI